MAESSLRDFIIATLLLLFVSPGSGIQHLKQEGYCHVNVPDTWQTAIVLLPGGSGYFTCIQNIKLVTTKFKSGGLHEKHVVATWNFGNHLSICFWAQGNQEKPVSR